MDPAQLPLRDVHLPDAVGWWPPAPGWWLLLALVLLIIVGLVAWHHRRKKYAAKKQALKEFARLKKAQNLSHQQRIAWLSKLLRQASISIFPRHEVAGLTGIEWLNFLDRTLQDGRFSKGIGGVLIEAPYKAVDECNTTDLFKLCDDWFKALPKQQR